MNLTPDQLPALNARFATAAPPDTVRWAVDTFGDQLIMTSSFGAESMCTIHMAAAAKPDIKIVVVNTGYLFPQTLAFMEQMRHRFNLHIYEYHSRNDPVVWLTVNGEPDPRVRKNVDACCAANKNEVFDRAMHELAPAGWIRGVRADQSETRAKMEVVQWNKRYNTWAISPILHWNGKQIHGYLKQHDLPYHPLYSQGYVSIGCNPETCTLPAGGDDDARSGRWAGTNKKECGIHLEDPDKPQ